MERLPLPAAVPFDDGWPAPHTLTSEEIDGREDFRRAFQRRRPATTSSNCTDSVMAI